MVERSDRMWSTGEGNGKPLQYSGLENPMNSMKKQNDRILKEELPRSVDAQIAILITMLQLQFFFAIFFNCYKILMNCYIIFTQDACYKYSKIFRF